MTWAPAFVGCELKGKTAGIIGLGNIGRKIAEHCDGLGMNVKYFSRNQKNCPYEYINLKKLFATCDYIFVSLSLNTSSSKLITKELLSLMKPTANLISIVGHPLFDEEYVLSMVKQNKLFGFAFESKKSLTEYEGNVFVTQSNAYYTKEALKEMFAIWTNNIVSAAQKHPDNVIN